MIGVIGDWAICVDIPVYTAEGVWYTYPGEDPVFVPGGVYWTCPKDEPFKVYAVVALVTTSVQVPTGIPSKPFAVVTGKGYVQVIVAGEPVDVIVPAINYTYRTQTPFDIPGEMRPYGAIVITTRGVYSNRLAGSEYNHSYTNPSITPPPDPADTSDRLPSYVPTKIDNVVQLSSTFLGNIYPLGSTTPSYTFAIYDKDGVEIFHRVDPACPNAEHQSEKCEYTGNFENFSYHPRSLEGGSSKLDRLDYIYGTYYCTTLVEVGLILSPTGGGIPGLGVIGTWCSPSGCKIFPLVQTIASYAAECPPNTCSIDCGSIRCCYDKEGNLVKTIPIAPSPSPISSYPAAAGSYASAMTSEDTSGTSSPSDFLGSP